MGTTVTDGGRTATIMRFARAYFSSAHVPPDERQYEKANGRECFIGSFVYFSILFIKFVNRGGIHVMISGQ